MLVAPNSASVPSLATKRKRRGATMMEYLFVLSFIGVVCIVGIGYFGSETNNLTQSTSSAINKSFSASQNTVVPPSGIVPSGGFDNPKDTKDKKKDDKTTSN
jgi:hypothetical protein